MPLSCNAGMDNALQKYTWEQDLALNFIREAKIVYFVWFLLFHVPQTPDHNLKIT